MRLYPLEINKSLCLRAFVPSCLRAFVLSSGQSKIQNPKSKIVRAIRVLEREFGVPVWTRKDPLDELMVTLLSQNTNDANRDRAYRALREHFPTWEQALKADVRRIERAIRPAGLSHQKSVRMKGILRWVQDTFGSLSLDFLKEMPDDEVIALLTSQKGIGVKTAAVVLAFALDRDICPVDTHVHRIAQRLGWVGEDTSAEETFHQLRELIPQGKAPTFHLNLLKFGRSRCAARKPLCQGCPMWGDCVWVGKTER